MKLWRSLFWAVPTYFLWNYLAPIYLTDIPEIYKSIPYWHIAGAFLLISIIRHILIPRKFHFSRMHRFRFRRGRRDFANQKYYHPG